MDKDVHGAHTFDLLGNIDISGDGDSYLDKRAEDSHRRNTGVESENVPMIDSKGDVPKEQLVKMNLVTAHTASTPAFG